ncbi:unnamed protein product [Calypogeia fissa]
MNQRFPIFAQVVGSIRQQFPGCMLRLKMRRLGPLVLFQVKKCSGGTLSLLCWNGCDIAGEERSGEWKLSKTDEEDEEPEENRVHY